MINCRILIKFSVRETKKLVIPATFLVLMVTLLASMDSNGKIAGITREAGGNLPLAGNSARPLPKLAQRDDPPELSARAALVQDAASGTVLYEKNADEKVPIASLTKLMTGIVVQKLVGLEEIVRIDARDTEVSQFRAELKAGETILVIDLLKAMLISSANDAAAALARYSGGTEENFVAAMNREAQALGMTDSRFTNPIGFDDPKHFSTARDLAVLVEEFMNYESLVQIVKIKDSMVVSADGREKHALVTTNHLLASHPEIAGLKTGYTSEAKGNLIILVNVPSGEPGEAAQYFSIILGSDNRERESEKIMEWVEKNYLWTHAESPK